MKLLINLKILVNYQMRTKLDVFSENTIRVNKIALILILSNYTIYKFKMKKFYNPEEVISSIGIMQSFKSALKNRMICDLKLYKRDYFIQHWDPGGEHMI